MDADRLAKSKQDRSGPMPSEDMKTWDNKSKRSASVFSPDVKECVCYALRGMSARVESRATTPRSVFRAPTPRSVAIGSTTELAGGGLFLHRHSASSFDCAAAPYDTVPKRVAGRVVNTQLMQPTGSGEYASWRSKDRYIPMSAAVGDFDSRPRPASTAAGPRASHSRVADSALNPFRFGRQQDAARYASEAYIHPHFGREQCPLTPLYTTPNAIT